MKKNAIRVFCLVLSLLLLLPLAVSCGKEKDPDDKGAYLYVYLDDQYFNYDPALATVNDSARAICSLIFSNLFRLDEKGKVQKDLVKSYSWGTDDDGNTTLEMTLGKTSWSDGTNVAGQDVIYSWQRALTVENSYDTASLLYDVKNARAIRSGDATIDDLGAYADQNKIFVTFEKEGVDKDQFLLNLTSLALSPLREEIVEKSDDWAKKPGTMVCSGPYKLRAISYVEGYEQIVLERNAYYYRDAEKDANKLDKSVKPYRIVIDYSKTPEEIMEAYNNGDIFYVGNIPLSLRGNYADAETVSTLSTFSLLFNENAVVREYSAAGFDALSANKSVYKANLIDKEDGNKIFADEHIRKALSLVLDREAIAEAVVYAKAANGLVPYGVFDTDRKTSFRDVGGNVISTSADKAAAEAELAKSDYKPGNFMFALSVPAYDDVAVAVAELVAEAWNSLGFHVAVNAIDEIVNDDVLASTGEIATDIRDDIFFEEYRAGHFDVVGIDFAALSPDPYSVLSRFAKAFSGKGMNMATLDYQLSAHLCGFDDEEYNALIEKVFAEKDTAKRAALLHDAEKLLLEKMPIIPVFFNEHVSMLNKSVGLKKVTFDYYGMPCFTKAKLKDYQLYLPVEEEETSSKKEDETAE